MSLADVDAEILQPMQATFLPPRQMDETAQTIALRGYGTALQDFSRGDLKVAWGDVLASHTGRAWPVPGVLVLAARKARKDRGDHAQPERRHAQDRTQNERWQEWERVRGTPLARRAVELGVAWSMRCAVLHDGKTMNELDLGAYQRGKQAAERTAAKIEAGEFVVSRDGKRRFQFSSKNADAAMKMWRNLLVNEAETEQEVMRFQPRGSEAA